MKRRQLISKLGVLSIAAPFALSSTSTLANSFEEFMKAQQAGVDEIKDEFESYKEDYLRAFGDYKTALEQEWQNPEISNQESWVEYSDDLKTKTVVDYESNEIRISYKANSTNQAISKHKVAKDIGALLTRTEKQAVQNDPINQNMTADFHQNHHDQNSKLQDDALLNEIPMLYGSIDKAEEKLATAAVVSQESTTKGEVVVVTIPLPTQLPFKRAQKYLASAQKSAHNWNIEPALVMAITHTESHFNPLARSHIPAFGLMQIVPSSAGKDASKYMYGQSRLLTSDELYNPHFNLDTGSAYLSMLQTRYLRGIKNPESRLYCAIAAYNTGTGNVAKAFIGRASMQSAYRTINSMPPESVFQVLKHHLPYKETRKYIIKVTKHLKKYRTLLA